MIDKLTPTPILYCKWLVVFFCMIISIDLFAQTKVSNETSNLKIISREASPMASKYYGSIYVEKNGIRLRTDNYISNNNGRTWLNSPVVPDFSAGLPKGYRRDSPLSVLDPVSGRIVTIMNALDVKDLDPTIFEPPIAQKTYYVRYRVSGDAGKTWDFDEPIIQNGNFTMENPFPGVFIGKNSVYLGDRGSMPIITRKRKILVPVQTTPLGADGELWNPGNGWTYTDVIVLIGKWTDDNKIIWETSERVIGDPKKSTRGMIEPTLLEMKDGRLLMVMRGSNEQTGSNDYSLPGYKWVSSSKNGGKSWSTPEPFTFEDGTAFYSPSSMSTLFKHSSGKCFWIGNMTDKNSEGNLPRWPLIIAEVNTKNLKLIKGSLLVLDTFQEGDKSKGRLDISHFSLIEDRETKEIILTYPRSYHAYESQEWITTRIAVE